MAVTQRTLLWRPFPQVLSVEDTHSFHRRYRERWTRVLLKSSAVAVVAVAVVAAAAGWVRHIVSTELVLHCTMCVHEVDELGRLQIPHGLVLFCIYLSSLVGPEALA